MADASLQEFIETASNVSPFRVEDDFGEGFVRLRSEEAERRQAAHDIRSSEDAVIELLRNSRDAHACNIFLATGREGDRRRILVIDDGDGIPAFMHGKIFEPRVTSKLETVHMDKWGVHGRGMALYSISVNSESARVVSSASGLGASIECVTDIRRLPEKADQSSFPRFEPAESGALAMRGPRNIIRTACEFAIDCAPAVNVYLGSFSEIAATLLAFSHASLTLAQRAFSDDPDSFPLCKRLAFAADAGELQAIAGSMGLDLSERTCRRVIDGEIAPLASLAELVMMRAPAPEPKPSKSRKKRLDLSDRRGLSIASEDLETFRSAIVDSFAPLARDYYLEADISPSISVGKDSITVTLPVQKL